VKKEIVQMVPGRKAWRDWVADVWKKSKIHEKIIEVLSSENLHPYTLSQCDSPGTWPDAAQWVPLAIDPVGGALFGEECYSDMERVRSPLRHTLKALITRTWILLYNSLNRSKKNIATLESDAIKAFQGLYPFNLFDFILNVRQTLIEAS
jgi:hypothetical protein